MVEVISAFKAGRTTDRELTQLRVEQCELHEVEHVSPRMLGANGPQTKPVQRRDALLVRVWGCAAVQRLGPLLIGGSSSS